VPPRWRGTAAGPEQRIARMARDLALCETNAYLSRSGVGTREIGEGAPDRQQQPVHASLSPVDQRARMPATYHLSHLGALESEAVHVMREVAAEFERPVLLFSGGKDSIVLLRLAEKAFRPAQLPFPVMHVDTGHNFPEVIEFRDRRIEEIGERLIVASVEESIRSGRAIEQRGARASRNGLQTITLLDAISEYGFDAAFGGARRDEERARAKERILSFRDEYGQWEPQRQRPELWSLYNGRIRKGEHARVFPLSNWTELDVWQYIAEEELEVPSIYFAHERELFEREGTSVTERGQTRADDRVSEAAMEDRKRQGYF
jgi:sulfate adenylyltransferase subunit 2